MKYINVADIVEPNGKTIRENNMEKQHNLRVGDLVEVKTDEWKGDGACMKIHARMFIVWCGRDCDGTPLIGCRQLQEIKWTILLWNLR